MNQNTSTNYKYILGQKVDYATFEKAIDNIIQLTNKQRSSYICASNVHMVMESFDSNNYQKIINNADIVVPDGKALVWAQKILGNKNAEQVRGEDVTRALCEMASEKGFPVGFYGSTPSLLEKIVDILTNNYSNLNIAYSFSPPFRKLSNSEDKKIVDEINASDVKILFVGLGCPKQEIWMAGHKDALNCTMLGVGAAFDFISGNKKNAPRWMVSMGLEWLFRLFSEPKRLWKRYLKHNPRFVWYFTLQLLGKKYE